MIGTFPQFHHLFLSTTTQKRYSLFPFSQPTAMSEEEEFSTRAVGGTEYSWCKAVLGGTGITVLGLLLSKPPHIPHLQTALRKLQNSNPTLRSNIHYDSSNNSFHYRTLSNSKIEIHPFDLKSTSEIIGRYSGDDSPFHLILEHELNQNTWRDPCGGDREVLCASVYTISEGRWGVFLRLHTSACDRSSAVALLKELLAKFGGGGEGTEVVGKGEKGMGMAIEDLIPEGKRNKPFWARGLDVLGYSLNSFRLGTLEFVDANSPRSSKVVRLQLDAHHTQLLLAGCKSRGIKLCGALAAAGMIASRASKKIPSFQREKYGVVTLIDCRPILEPVLSNNHLGFYHSAILNTHDVCGETLWDLAKRSYMAFANAMNCNKHFSDMSDLNYLMCKAIENPGLTPSSSLRTALVSVFEDPVIDDSDEMHKEIGLEDCVGCASVHGVGPSIAIFDTIRKGKLDCACVYPSPLHSREQMQELVDHMKRILVDGCNSEGQ